MQAEMKQRNIPKVTKENKVRRTDNQISAKTTTQIFNSFKHDSKKF